MRHFVHEGAERFNQIINEVKGIGPGGVMYAKCGQEVRRRRRHVRWPRAQRHNRNLKAHCVGPLHSPSKILEQVRPVNARCLRFKIIRITGIDTLCHGK